jgi:uncharacterized protein YbaP (TraB family)
MKILTKIVSFVIMLAILSTSSIFAAENKAEAAVQDSPSLWASWDVQMAYTYGLGDSTSYMKFGDITKGSNYFAVSASLEQKFGVVDTTKDASDSQMSRGSVIDELFDIIQLVLKPQEQNALDYFVSNKLIMGNGSGYSLDKACTQEEMLVFAVRVYDYLVYSRGLEAKGAFWKVSDDDNTIYLLGSIHITDGSVFPMSKDILNAFCDSETLVVEANLLSQNQEEQAYMRENMYYSDGTTINKVLSKEVYEAYVAQIQAYGVKPEEYNYLKPWAAALVLQNLQLSSTSVASMGIDLYFIMMAAGVKPIVEIEGLKFQTDMFDSFSAELQQSILADALAGGDTIGEDMQGMIELWNKGDTAALQELLFSEEATDELSIEFNDKFWGARNKNMALKCKDMLENDTENDYFYVVGAGHMLNDNGVIEELIKLGYNVEQAK